MFGEQSRRKVKVSENETQTQTQTVGVEPVIASDGINTNIKLPPKVEFESSDNPRVPQYSDLLEKSWQGFGMTTVNNKFSGPPPDSVSMPRVPQYSDLSEKSWQSFDMTIVNNKFEGTSPASVSIHRDLQYSDLLKKFERSLDIPDKEVSYGSAVQQTLVACAGVYTSQVGASFDKCDNGICFLLNFSNNAEHTRFILHYINRYRGSILQQGHFQQGEPTKVVFDIQPLYDFITSELREYRREYSLRNILTSLVSSLKVEHKELGIGGDALQRRLVGKAGISTSQREADFVIGEDYCTIFNLAFASRSEHETFLSYYNTNYPDFIIRHDAHREGRLSKVEVSSNILLKVVAPTLDSSLDRQR